MKKVTIVGMGLGEDTLTAEAIKAIRQAEVLLGAPRALKLCSRFFAQSRGGSFTRSYPYYLPKDVADAIEKDDAQNFVVLVSGDVGFYSAAAGMCELLAAYDLHFVAGISTVNAFFAKLKLPWQDAVFISAHGRNTNAADMVRRNRLTFCLTGNNIAGIGTALCNAGFGSIKTYVGENLGTEQEKIYNVTAKQLVNGDYPTLTVLLFVNESADDTTICGLPDDKLTRLAGIPMTKSETRAVVFSKLRLRRDSICWDVGAGSGSVTVEMAHCAYRGHVYAVERKEEAIPLIEENCRAYHLGNVTAIHGEAPFALADLPSPDAVFIGGSGGGLGEIINGILLKNPKARIVVTAVTIETVSAALKAFVDAGLDPEIIQLSVARGRPVGELHLMEALNPVTILSAGGIL